MASGILEGHSRMKKDLAIIGGLFFAIALLMIFGKGFTSTSFLASQEKSSTKSASGSILSSEVPIEIGDVTFNALVAKTEAEQKKGLSKRESLPIGSAMLFIFNTEDEHAIWMKDMKFAIDIIWLDVNKHIVDIATNAAPEPGKSYRDLQIYKPKEKSKYVLEINAGISALNNFQIGDIVVF